MLLGMDEFIIFHERDHIMSPYFLDILENTRSIWWRAGVYVLSPYWAGCTHGYPTGFVLLTLVMHLGIHSCQMVSAGPGRFDNLTWWPKKVTMKYWIYSQIYAQSGWDVYKEDRLCLRNWYCRFSDVTVMQSYGPTLFTKLRPRQKRWLSCRWHFQINFLEWKLLYLNSNFTGILFPRFQLKLWQHCFR